MQRQTSPFVTRCFAVLCLGVGACARGPGEPSPFDSRPFASFSGRSILCLDLRTDDGVPDAGLLLRIGPSDTAGRRSIVLPLGSRAVGASRNILSASASYENLTVVSFSVGAQSLGASPIAFEPRVATFEGERPPLDGVRSGLYFEENGQERWLVLIDSSASIIRSLRTEFGRTELEPVEAVAIALPEKAEGREVRRGMTVFPQPSIRLSNVMLFSASSDGKRSERIEIRYVVPATAQQLAVSSGGFKLIAVVVLPIMTLLLLPPKDIGRPQARRIILVILIVLQVALLGFILWAAITNRREVSSTLWLDLAATLLGTAGEGGVIWIKSSPRKSA